MKHNQNQIQSKPTQISSTIPLQHTLSLQSKLDQGNQYNSQQNKYNPIQNQYNPGQNQNNPGQNQYNPGQNQYNPGQNQYNPGQNQYNLGQSQYNSVQNPYNPEQNQYIFHQNEFSSHQNQHNTQQNLPNIQSDIQLNVQPLVKPIQLSGRNQPVQAVAPIVYSFGQIDYSNRLNQQNNSRVHKKLSWAMGDSLQADDDFADLLG